MRAIILSLSCALALGVALTSCDDGGGAGEPDAGPDADPLPGCFQGTPTTHDELINACTPATVEKLHKRPTLPLLGPDGVLPPLP